VTVSDGVTTVGPYTATVTGGTWAVSGMDVSSLNNGTITYTATATDQYGTTATASKTATKTNKQSQYIDFPQPDVHLIDSKNTPTSSDISATSRKLSDDSPTFLTVTFTSNTPTICTVGSSTIDGSGTSHASLTVLKPGTCSITATQNGDANYFPAVPVTRTFLVSRLLVTNLQAMEGDLKLAPGTILKVGYDFTIPGNHPDTTVQFLTTKVTFTWTCVSGNATGTFDVTIGDQTYLDQLNSSAWYPSGVQSDPSVYQNSTFTVPNKCGGGLVRLQKGGVFTSGVSSSSTEKINVRWHYSANGSSGSWSGTYGVVPF
jgi:hypothetical protein